MRIVLLAAALLASAPAFASDTTAVSAGAAAPQIKAGAMLRDANNARLGNVNRVNADGSVSIIIDSKFVTVPASTLTVADGKVRTSLSKREVISQR